MIIRVPPLAPSSAESRATAHPSPRREVVPFALRRSFPAGIFTRPPRRGIHDARDHRDDGAEAFAVRQGTCQIPGGTYAGRGRARRAS
jgi:hypothetical protein